MLGERSLKHPPPRIQHDAIGVLGVESTHVAKHHDSFGTPHEREGVREVFEDRCWQLVAKWLEGFDIPTHASPFAYRDALVLWERSLFELPFEAGAGEVSVR